MVLPAATSQDCADTPAAPAPPSPQAGIDPTTLKADKPRLAVVPFESEHKFMATVHDAPGGKRVLYVKGASDRLLPLCKAQVVGDNLTSSAPLDLGFWNKAQSALSSQGLRVLALTWWAGRSWEWRVGARCRRRAHAVGNTRAWQHPCVLAPGRVTHLRAARPVPPPSAELPANEDLTALTAQSLQKRPPFLTMLAFFGESCRVCTRGS